MRIGRKLLLALCATSLCTGGAYAQVPPTLGPADGSADYVSPTTDPYPHERVDNIPAPNTNIVYQTMDTKTTFYVAPSLLMHPAPHDKVIGVPLGSSKWKWLFNAPQNAFTFDGYTAGTEEAKNYVTVKATNVEANLGEAIIEVKEIDGCEGLSTFFKVIATGKPSLEITAASIGTLNATDLATPPVGATEIAGAKGYMIQTCDKTAVENKILKISLKSTEQGVPDAYRKYSFAIKQAEYTQAAAYTSVGAPTTALEHQLKTAAGVNGKLQILDAGADVNITLPTTVTLAPADKYKDYIYYLSGAEGRTGVVSMVSHRSNLDNTGAKTATFDSYPFDKVNKGFYVVVRVMSQLKTGPVYFIPYID